MLELAALGSKVMQARSVEFAKKFGVVFEVRSSFNDNPGTIVKEETAKMEDVVIRGVAVDKNQAKVTIAGVPDKPGIAAKVFKTIADANINIDVIVQNVSEKGFTDISFTVGSGEAGKSTKVLQPVVKGIGAREVTSTSGYRQTLRRRDRDAVPPGRRGEDVRDAGRQWRQYRHDLHQRNQDLGDYRPQGCRQGRPCHS